jgi:hypothetical protein
MIHRTQVCEEVGAHGYTHAHLGIPYDYKDARTLFNAIMVAQVSTAHASRHGHRPPAGQLPTQEGWPAQERTIPYFNFNRQRSTPYHLVNYMLEDRGRWAFKEPAQLLQQGQGQDMLPATLDATLSAGQQRAHAAKATNALKNRERQQKRRQQPGVKAAEALQQKKRRQQPGVKATEALRQKKHRQKPEVKEAAALQRKKRRQQGARRCDLWLAQATTRLHFRQVGSNEVPMQMKPPHLWSMMPPHLRGLLEDLLRVCIVMPVIGCLHCLLGCLPCNMAICYDFLFSALGSQQRRQRRCTGTGITSVGKTYLPLHHRMPEPFHTALAVPCARAAVPTFGAG